MASDVSWVCTWILTETIDWISNRILDFTFTYQDWEEPGISEKMVTLLFTLLSGESFSAMLLLTQVRPSLQQHPKHLPHPRHSFFGPWQEPSSLNKHLHVSGKELQNSSTKATHSTQKAQWTVNTLYFCIEPFTGGLAGRQMRKYICNFKCAINSAEGAWARRDGNNYPIRSMKR